MSWAPQSPDLSGYAPQSPDLSAYNNNNNHHNSRFPPENNNHNHQQNVPWTPQSPDFSAYPAQQYGPQYPPHPQYQQPSHFNLDGASDRNWNQKPQQSNQFISPQFSQYPQQQHPHYPNQPLAQPHQNPYGMPAQTRGHRVSYKEETFKEEDDDWRAQPRALPHGGQAVKPDNGAFADPGFASIPPAHQPPPATRQRIDTHGIEVKTKFPTARIKRIMQADEDVGKVAQVTPVVVAKALELFMIRLITASATVAKSKGSKKVSTAHMKQAVMGDEQFDNLRDIVGKVPDAPTKKAEDDDDEDAEGASKKRKKSTAAAGRKKRKDSDED